MLFETKGARVLHVVRTWWILQYRAPEPEYGSDEFPDVENDPETALYGDKAIAELQHSNYDGSRRC